MSEGFQVWLVVTLSITMVCSIISVALLLLRSGDEL